MYGGIYPRDRCRGYLTASSSKGFVTPLQVAHDIIRCLSGGTAAYLQHETLGLEHIFGASRNDRYEHYLYE